jgi:predicted acetyltransferase
MKLVWPAERYLESYAAALARGWSPDNVRPEASREQLDRIATDRTAFVAELVDREGKGAPITLPDGSTMPRLPGYHRWMWDGDFCGSIGFRWQAGTNELPPHCLGHIGFSVVPWKRRRGHATRALALLLPETKEEGLAYVELTTDVDNTASQRVIVANGGRLVERFRKSHEYGGSESLRFRIELGTLTW